jgi:hypothetical protein
MNEKLFGKELYNAYDKSIDELEEAHVRAGNAMKSEGAHGHEQLNSATEKNRDSEARRQLENMRKILGGIAQNGKPPEGVTLPSTIGVDELAPGEQPTK